MTKIRIYNVLTLLILLFICAFPIFAQDNWNTYSCGGYYSISYPKTWEIVQENAYAAANVNISLQIMKRRTSEYEFCPNINIIVSAKKWQESPYTLIAQQQKRMSMLADWLGEVKCTTVNGYAAAIRDYTCPISGFVLYGRQYVIKKPDNTTYTITLTADNAQKESQLNTLMRIFNTLIIK